MKIKICAFSKMLGIMKIGLEQNIKKHIKIKPPLYVDNEFEKEGWKRITDWYEPVRYPIEERIIWAERNYAVFEKNNKKIQINIFYTRIRGRILEYYPYFPITGDERFEITKIAQELEKEISFHKEPVWDEPIPGELEILSENEKRYLPSWYLDSY